MMGHMSRIAVVSHRLVLATLPTLVACGGSLGAGGADAAAGFVGTGTGATGGGTGGVGLFGGGGSGVGGGASGGGGGGAVCGKHGVLGPGAVIGTPGPLGGVYDGPAIIERSNAEDMVITFMPARAADAGAPLPMHVEIRQMSPMPRLPVGARVWLSKRPAGNQSEPWYSGVAPWALSVRTRQGGDLLFGLSRNAPDTISRAGPRRRCAVRYATRPTRTPARRAAA